MRKIISECVGCPDGCRHCGLDRVEVLACDNCGAEGTDIYSVDGAGEYCEECAKKIMVQDINPLDLGDALDIACARIYSGQRL